MCFRLKGITKTDVFENPLVIWSFHSQKEVGGKQLHTRLPSEILTLAKKKMISVGRPYWIIKWGVSMPEGQERGNVWIHLSCWEQINDAWDTFTSGICRWAAVWQHKFPSYNFEDFALYLAPTALFAYLFSYLVSWDVQLQFAIVKWLGAYLM